RPSIACRIVALHQDRFVGGHVREVVPAMSMIIGAVVDFTRTVWVDELRRHQIAPCDGTPVDKPEWIAPDRAAYGLPDIDLDIAMLEPRQRFLGGQDISRALRPGLLGVVVVDDMYGGPRSWTISPVADS